MVTLIFQELQKDHNDTIYFSKKHAFRYVH